MPLSLQYIEPLIVIPNAWPSGNGREWKRFEGKTQQQQKFVKNENDFHKILLQIILVFLQRLWHDKSMDLIAAAM